MTKAELIKALERYTDDQYVYICLHTDHYPDGCQIIIQGVCETPPWHEGPPKLIGLEASDKNKAICNPPANPS